MEVWIHSDLGAWAGALDIVQAEGCTSRVDPKPLNPEYRGLSD